MHMGSGVNWAGVYVSGAGVCVRGRCVSQHAPRQGWVFWGVGVQGVCGCPEGVWVSKGRCVHGLCVDRGCTLPAPHSPHPLSKTRPLNRMVSILSGYILVMK